MSKRLRVTSRVSKKGRSLRPRSFPPRSPTSSAPPLGELDFDSTAPVAESFPPPQVEQEDSEGDSGAGEDVMPAPLHAPSDDRLAAEHRREPAAQNGSHETPHASFEAPHASSPEDEGVGNVEPAPASADAFSGEFFRKETDSVPPSVDASRTEADDVAPRSLSPQAIAYQARLRKIVAGVLAGVGLLALAVAGKALLARRAAAPPARPAPAKVELAAPQQAPVQQPVPPPPPAAQTQTAPSAAPSGSSSPDAVQVGEAKAAETPAVDVVALKKEAENLMNRGKFNDAIEKARVAIAADPSDALPYLYLGSSLQETGKWKEGVEAYSECVRHATKGPIHECRAMGGRK